LEERGLSGLLAACEAPPRGRSADGAAAVQALTKENERLKRELTRQQALVRLTQRTVGVPPPVAGKTAEKKRKRRASVRALRRAERWREETPEAAGAEAPGAMDTA
jgi:hypothetical protein